MKASGRKRENNWSRKTILKVWLSSWCQRPSIAYHSSTLTSHVSHPASIVSDKIIGSVWKAICLRCLRIKADEDDLMERGKLWKKGIPLCQFPMPDGNYNPPSEEHPVQSRVISSPLSGTTCIIHAPIYLESYTQTKAHTHCGAHIIHSVCSN